MSRKQNQLDESSKPEASTPDDTTFAASKLAELKTKSATIRALAAAEWPRSRIAKALNIRYQHVRNVLTAPVKQQ